MTPLSPASSHARSIDRAVAPDRPSAPPGFDGVLGDVLLTVLLSAALAALVGAVLLLLWWVLPSASRIAALSFAMVMPPPGRPGAAGAQDGGALRTVLLRVGAAVAIPVVAVAVTFAVWSRDAIAAPAAVAVGLLLIVVELKLLGSEAWRRVRRPW